jgi:hypothetical protein
MCVGKRWKREKRGVKCVRKQKKQVQFVHRNGDPCDRNEKKFIRKKKGEKCAGKMKKVSGPHHPQMIKAYQPMVQHPLPPAPDRYPPPPTKEDCKIPFFSALCSLLNNGHFWEI